MARLIFGFVLNNLQITSQKNRKVGKKVFNGAFITRRLFMISAFLWMLWNHWDGNIGYCRIPNHFTVNTTISWGKRRKTLYASDGKCFFNILLIFRGLFKFLMYLCISGLIYYLLLVIFHRCWHFNQLCYIIKLGSVEGNLLNLCWMASVKLFTQNSRISRKSLVSIHLFYTSEQFLWEDDLQKPPQNLKKI